MVDMHLSSIWQWVLTPHSVVIPVAPTQKQNVNVNLANNSNEKRKDHKERGGVFPLNTTSPSIPLFPPSAYLTSDD